jgi:hypothetical protein
VVAHNCCVVRNALLLQRYCWAPDKSDKVLLQPPSQLVNYSEDCSKLQKASTMKKKSKKITQRRKLVSVKSLDIRQPQTDVLSNRYIAEVLRIYTTSVLLYFSLSKRQSHLCNTAQGTVATASNVRVQDLAGHLADRTAVSFIIDVEPKHLLCYPFFLLGTTSAGGISSCQFGSYRRKCNSCNPGDLYRRQDSGYHAE